MAIILSKTFDVAHGRVMYSVQDAALGRISTHTLYFLQPDGTTNDVPTLETQMLNDTEAQAVALKAAMIANGWQPSGN